MREFLAARLLAGGGLWHTLRMNIFDRIFALHRELKRSRQPVSRVKLEEQLECSTATIKRIIQQMRDYLNAPIEYDREANGYFYAEQN